MIDQYRLRQRGMHDELRRQLGDVAGEQAPPLRFAADVPPSENSRTGNPFAYELFRQLQVQVVPVVQQIAIERVARIVEDQVAGPESRARQARDVPRAADYQDQEAIALSSATDFRSRTNRALGRTTLRDDGDRRQLQRCHFQFVFRGRCGR